MDTDGTVWGEGSRQEVGGDVCVYMCVQVRVCVWIKGSYCDLAVNALIIGWLAGNKHTKHTHIYTNIFPVAGKHTEINKYF